MTPATMCMEAARLNAEERARRGQSIRMHLTVYADDVAGAGGALTIVTRRKAKIFALTRADVAELARVAQAAERELTARERERREVAA